MSLRECLLPKNGALYQEAGCNKKEKFIYFYFIKYLLLSIAIFVNDISFCSRKELEEEDYIREMYNHYLLCLLMKVRPYELHVNDIVNAP